MCAAVQIVINDESLSGGAIGGIVAGAVGFLLLVIGVIMFVLHRRRKWRHRYTGSGVHKVRLVRQYRDLVDLASHLIYG